MASADLTNAPAYVVPRGLLVESAATLRALSDGVRESVVLWVGTEQGGRALVKRLVAPRQRTSPSHFDVPLEERLRIVQELAAGGEKLLAQLHTHPGPAFHSEADDRLALPRHTGAISIVVPHFGRGWEGDLRHVSVNRHLGQGVWQELSRDALSLSFEVV